MSNIPNIEGMPNPKRTSGAHGDEHVDADKFKRILKVDESDDTQKRHKRQRTKQEEEMSPEEDDEAELNTPVGNAFSSLLSDKPTKENLFATREVNGEIITVENSDTTPSDQPYNLFSAQNDKNVPYTTGGALNIQNGVVTTPGETEDMPVIVPAKSAAKEKENKDQPKDKKKETSEAMPYAKKDVPKEPKKVLPSPISVATKKSEKSEAKPKPPLHDRPKETPVKPAKEAATEVPPLFAKESAKDTPKEIEKKSPELPILPNFEQPKVLTEDKHVNLPKLSIKEVSEERTESTIESMPSLPLVEKPITTPMQKSDHKGEKEKIIAAPSQSHEMSPSDKDKKEGDREKHEKEPPLNIASYMQPIEPAQFVAAPTETSAPIYSTLSPHVFELFEKMVGYIMIEQYKGVSTTTVKVQMPGSVFHGCEIKLDHYDTAPHSFHIQLLGSPDAVNLFNTNFDALQSALNQSQSTFSINLRKPALAEEYRHLIKRKSSAGGDSASQDKQDQ